MAALVLAVPAGAAADTTGMFLRLGPDAGAASIARTLARDGIRVTNRFPAIRMVFAVGPRQRLRAAVDRSRQIAYAQPLRRVVPAAGTAGWATGTAIAGQPVGGGPYRDPAGRPLTGRGVGIAIVDSGVQPSHPDFAGRYAANIVVQCVPISSDPAIPCGETVAQDIGPVDLDADAGHGSHVAGIAAGDGAASRGTFRGVAPEATISSVNIGVVSTNLHEAVAFQWVLDHAATANPPIRVLNMSYGEPGGATQDPEQPDVLALLARELVKRGVTVVVSAMNAGGDGSADATSSINDEPAVIGVANYDDLQRGSRAGGLAVSSSRGRRGMPRTYPKLSAPGELITSTCLTGRPLCAAGLAPWQPWYSTISGTSMAAPHVTGAVALIAQARPELTPAQVRDALQDTALRFGADYEPDPTNADGATSFDKGAGLLDLPAALDALGVARDGLPAADAEQLVATDEAGDAPSGADITRLTATPTAGGVRYRITFAAAVTGADVTIRQIVDGVARTVSFAGVSGTVADLTAGYAALGDPPSGTAVHDVVAAASTGPVPGDVAPGDALEARTQDLSAGAQVSVGANSPHSLGHLEVGRFTIVR
jgi:serine protease AprX